jgi:hypothetical protein
MSKSATNRGPSMAAGTYGMSHFLGYGTVPGSPAPVQGAPADQLRQVPSTLLTKCSSYPRLSNTSVAWMRSPPIIPLLPLLAVVMVWSR